MAISKIDTNAIANDAVTSAKIDTNIDVSGSVTADSINLNAGYGSDAAIYGVRAWVNFDGTTNVAGNCTIRASGNVSSVADNGTGDYTVNFTTSMPDTNYSVAADTNTESDAYSYRAGSNNKTTGSCDIRIGSGVNGSSPYYLDKNYVSAIFVR